MDPLEKYLIDKCKELGDQFEDTVSIDCEVWYHRHEPTDKNNISISYRLYRASLCKIIVKADSFSEFAKKLEELIQPKEVDNDNSDS